MREPDKQPAIFLPHGGGPWPFVTGAMESSDIWGELRDYLTTLPARLPARPKAVLCISAHWETLSPTVLTDEQPALLFDYYGFPPETYQLRYPAPGAPDLASQVRALLSSACIPTDEVAQRGFDHGVFIPMMLLFPRADVPILMMSIQRRTSVDSHLKVGRALEPLRNEGVLIVGSGMSYHNLPEFFSQTPEAVASAHAFDAWLTEAIENDDAPERNARLRDWQSAPGARRSHPTVDHLEPLFVVAGAAGSDPGRCVFRTEIAGKPLSAYHFG